MDNMYIEGSKGNIAFLKNFLYARCQVFSSLFYVLSSLFCFFSGRNFRGESQKIKQFTKTTFFPMEGLKIKGLTRILRAFEYPYKHKQLKRNFRVKSQKFKQKAKTKFSRAKLDLQKEREKIAEEVFKIGIIRGLVKAGYKEGSKEIVCFLKHRYNLLVVAAALKEAQKEKNAVGIFFTWEKLEENTKVLTRALEALKQGGKEKEITLLLDMIGLKETRLPLGLDMEFKGSHKGNKKS